MMFSNDNNIETIAQLVEQAKKYVALKGEYLRLTAVEKTVRLLTAVAMTLVLSVVFLLALIAFSIALAFYFGETMGYVLGFALVGGIYILMLLACLAFRKQWIERPLVRFLAKLLME